jgi:hypothetical protein
LKAKADRTEPATTMMPMITTSTMAISCIVQPIIGCTNRGPYIEASHPGKSKSIRCSQSMKLAYNLGSPVYILQRKKTVLPGGAPPILLRFQTALTHAVNIADLRQVVGGNPDFCTIQPRQARILPESRGRPGPPASPLAVWPPHP